MRSANKLHNIYKYKIGARFFAFIFNAIINNITSAHN